MLSLCARVLAALVAAAVLVAVPTGAAEADKRWVFYTKNKHYYDSPWYAGAHRIMIPFGCTRAPYYDPDPRCKDDHGFHHGIDIAMPCGTKLRSPRYAHVVSNDSLGPAYGGNPLLLRNYRHGWDVIIGHTRKVFVQPGDRVTPGMKIARADDWGAPDGCHLHFEKRALGGGLDTAMRPRELLDLKKVRT
jgi:murein DD-endopeptidase MepM/ murein hydrolase activator NlpD